MILQSERLVSESKNQTDITYEKSLRPKNFSEYIGQKSVCEKLEIYIQAAMQRNEALDHVLLFGPPGLGKTTLAKVIATAIGSRVIHTSGPAIERAGDLAAILTQLEPKDILFIDEIHRLSPVVEEILYPALEDCELDIVVGEGQTARNVKIPLPPFTLIGATTRVGLLTSPLRDRFGIVERLQFYSVEELGQIVLRSAEKLEVQIDNGGALAIASRARGTPRIANRLLKRVRDIIEVDQEALISEETAERALLRLAVDQNGLDWSDQRLLTAIIEYYDGGPVGLETLSALLAESKETIEDLIEPYLIQQGWLQRTARGRIVTSHGYALLGVKKQAHG